MVITVYDARRDEIFSKHCRAWSKIIISAAIPYTWCYKIWTRAKSKSKYSTCFYWRLYSHTPQRLEIFRDLKILFHPDAWITFFVGLVWFTLLLGISCRVFACTNSSSGKYLLLLLFQLNLHCSYLLVLTLLSSWTLKLTPCWDTLATRPLLILHSCAQISPTAGWQLGSLNFPGKEGHITVLYDYHASKSTPYCSFFWQRR